MCGGDGSCDAPVDGELGDYIGAQMGAANLGDAAPVTPAPTSLPVTTHTPSTIELPTPIPCVGNCNGDGSVTVDELLTLVNIALGNADVSTCRPGDANHDNQITIDEILTAVNNALNGCAVP